MRRVTPLSEMAVETQLAGCRARLFEARALRPAPPLDDKILADWNGLMIAALARASFVFEAPKFLEAARGRLLTCRRIFATRAGVSSIPRAETQSERRRCSTITPLLREPRCSYSRRRASRRIWRRLVARARGEKLVWRRGRRLLSDRPRRGRRAKGAGEDRYDGAAPSGVGLIAEVLVKLYHLTDGAEWREAAERLIRAFAGASPRSSPIARCCCLPPIGSSAADAFLSRGRSTTRSPRILRTSR